MSKLIQYRYTIVMLYMTVLLLATKSSIPATDTVLLARYPWMILASIIATLVFAILDTLMRDKK